MNEDLFLVAASWRLYCTAEQVKRPVWGVDVLLDLRRRGLARLAGKRALEQALTEQANIPRGWRAFEICNWAGLFQTRSGQSYVPTIYWNRLAWVPGLRSSALHFTRHQPNLLPLEVAP